MRNKSSIARLRRASLQTSSSSSQNGIVMFNPTDPKYQKCKEFPPNQLEVWDKFQPDHAASNTLYELNAAHLFEVTSMKNALIKMGERSPIPAWACRSIKAWWKSHYEWVQARYSINQKVFTPSMEKRFSYPDEVKQANKAYIQDLERISNIIEQLHVDESSINVLLENWTSYENNIFVFNSLQDNMLIMLYHAYFSPKELSDMRSRNILKLGSSNSMMGAFIHSAGVDKFRSEIMPRENVPAKAWDLKLKKIYHCYVADVVIHLDILSSGTPSVFWLNQDRNILFNPLNPTYQVSEKFLPNKWEEWKEDADDIFDRSPCYLAGIAHRAEIEMMKEALIEVNNRGPLEEWEVSSINTWFNTHYEWITTFHKFTRNDLIPFLETRLHYPVELLEGQEDYVNQLLDISILVRSLKTGDEAHKLLSLWSNYEEKTNAFLDLFGERYFLLNHAYFSRSDNATFEKQSSKKIALFAGPMIYQAWKGNLREVTTKGEENDDLYWHLDMGAKYEEYAQKVVVHLDALKTGMAPETEKGRFKKIALLLANNLKEETIVRNENRHQGLSSEETTTDKRSSWQIPPPKEAVAGNESQHRRRSLWNASWNFDMADEKVIPG